MSVTISGMGSAGMPQVMAGASARMAPTQKMSNLFQQIDTSGSGSITKAQFEQAFQTMKTPPAFKAMGADAVFSKLDPNGTGSVTKQDFVDGMKNLMRSVHQHRSSATSSQSGVGVSPSGQILSDSLDALKALGKRTDQGTGGSGSQLDVTA
jgi:hypothetical protein